METICFVTPIAASEQLIGEVERHAVVKAVPLRTGSPDVHHKRDEVLLERVRERLPVLHHLDKVQVQQVEAECGGKQVPEALDAVQEDVQHLCPPRRPAGTSVRGLPAQDHQADADLGRKIERAGEPQPKHDRGTVVQHVDEEFADDRVGRVEGVDLREREVR
jgi:hypothetical protein